MAINSVSIANTTQATADTFGLKEDQFNLTSIVVLDVMANDLGGNAKKLYSIDDGDNTLKDLLTKDATLTTAWEATAEGNSIRIANGKIEFKLADSFNVNSLNQDERYQDTFVYAIQMGNGTLSYAKVTVNIDGINDLATITGDTTGALTEDADVSVAHGTLKVTDADHGESAFRAAANLKGSYGDFSFNAGSGEWSYTLDNTATAVQALSAGEKQTDSLTVVTADGTQQVLSVTITGSNDAPLITSAATASFSENGIGIAYTATASDAEAGNTLTYTLGGADAARFSINASSGAVSFATAPNFEAPTDVGGDNIYNITVTASDGANNSAAKDVALTVTDVVEATPVFDFVGYFAGSSVGIFGIYLPLIDGDLSSFFSNSGGAAEDAWMTSDWVAVGATGQTDNLALTNAVWSANGKQALGTVDVSTWTNESVLVNILKFVVNGVDQTGDSTFDYADVQAYALTRSAFISSALGFANQVKSLVAGSVVAYFDGSAFDSGETVNLIGTYQGGTATDSLIAIG